MNYYFARGAAQLQDSMTEPQFRKSIKLRDCENGLRAHRCKAFQTIYKISGYGLDKGLSPEFENVG